MPAYQRVTTGEANAVHAPRPGTQALLDVIITELHIRGARTGGIYNRRTVRGGKAWSLHSAGRACDVMVPSVNGMASEAGKKLGDELFLRCIAAADQCGICEIIWWDKRWTGDKGVQRYKPRNHFDHVHIGQTVDMSSRRDTAELRKWFRHFLFLAH